jgi:hypothetical protein
MMALTYVLNAFGSQIIDTLVQLPMGWRRNTFVDEGTPPREWAERLYNVVRWTSMSSGGHFAPAEEPERLARDIASFFADL